MKSVALSIAGGANVVGEKSNPPMPGVLLGTRILAVLGVASAMCSTGCASTTEGLALMQPESTPGVASVLVGPASVVDAHVNPSQGMSISAEGDSIVIRFARRGRQAAAARLESTSLEAISMTTDPDDHLPMHVRPGPIVLDGGRFIVCWKTGDFERGYRAVAQTFNAADGSPRGAPVVISPPGLDVIGTPRAVKIDGHRAVATFEASTGEAFALFAVSIEAI
jgi:hypothetical protein